MSKKNFYDILEVSKSASDDEIKKSYRRLAKKYHPDVNKGDKGAEDRFKQISEAYDVLSDSQKRKQYDLLGTYGANAGPGFDPSDWARQAYQKGGNTWSGKGGFGDFEDILRQAGGQGRGGSYRSSSFDDLGDIFGDIFGGMGGASKASSSSQSYTQSGAAKGRDIYYSMEIDFLEAYQGTESKITLQREGKTEKIQVKIPAGVKTGSRIRLAGKGESAGPRGKAGDLYIEIKVKEHPYFKTEGEDVYLDLPITVGEAILGTEVKVPTLDGSVSLKIPAGTSSGQKFRLKGKGLLSIENKSKGDFYVIPKIEVPKTPSDTSKKLIEEFEKQNVLHLRKF